MNLQTALVEKQQIEEETSRLMKANKLKEMFSLMKSQRMCELDEFLTEHDPFEWYLQNYKGKYLKSSLWRKIKRRVLKRDNYVCQRHECGIKAKEIHHRSYDPEVMRGNDDSKLISLCSGCHSYISFDESGKLRPTEEQERLLIEKPDRTILPPIQVVWGRLGGKKIKAAHHPGNGFSKLQLEAWRKEVRTMGVEYIRLAPRKYWPV